MNDQIFETIVTTVGADGSTPHIAPMGVRYRDGRVILMPFRPSTTLDNILATGHAVLNLLTDTRVFAGSVTARWLGQRPFPLLPAERIAGVRLAAALGHVELRLEPPSAEARSAQRPVLEMTRVHEARHAPFIGFNRAQAAVIEGAVLVSRLHMLSADKIDGEIAYLQIAIDRTAGSEEREAWSWLQEAIAHHRVASASRGDSANGVSDGASRSASGGAGGDASGDAGGGASGDASAGQAGGGAAADADASAP